MPIPTRRLVITKDEGMKTEPIPIRTEKSIIFTKSAKKKGVVRFLQRKANINKRKATQKHRDRKKRQAFKHHKYLQQNRVIHRSLMLNHNDIADLHKNGQSLHSSPLSRRFSADDKSKIKTYVVLHQPSHNYQFFNQRNQRSSTHWDDKHKQQKHVRKIERLNFDRMENEIYHKESANMKYNRGLYKWIICLIIGILTGLCMYMITIAIQAILTLVVLDQTRYLLKESWCKGTLYFLGCNVLCGLISVLSVIYIEKAAAGSGIPEVKAYLNGSWIPHLFNIRTLFVKLFGVIFAVSGSFIVGKEGPMVCDLYILSEHLNP